MNIKSITHRVLPNRVLRKQAIIKYRIKNPFFSELIKQNEKFHNIHKGERGFILGNGPSLSNVDFSLLKNEIVFTVNQISRNEKYYQLDSNYHMWTDTVFFNPNEKEIIQIMKDVNSEDNRPVCFYDAHAYHFIKETKLDEYLDIEYLADGKYLYQDTEIDIDFTAPVPTFPTTVLHMISLAVFMGISEIYLLGCDCTSILNIISAKLNQTDQYAYGYKISGGEKKRLIQSGSRYTIQDELRFNAKIFDDYALMRDYCEKRNVKIYNCTQSSLLESIEKVDLLQVL